MKQIFKPVPLVLAAFSLWITWVCSSLLQFDDTGNLVAHSYSIWGDWSAHFTFINALRERGFGWLAGDNPLFAGVPFQYPFLSHVLTYFFSLLTFTDTIHATYILSLLLVLIFPYVLYRLFRRLSLNPWPAIASTFVYLLIGGYQWMSSGNLKASEPLTNQFDSGSVFTQFILFEFFPQRAILFGVLALAACASYAIVQKSWTIKKMLGMGAVLSLLSILHIHTWISMGALLVMLFALYPFQNSKSRMRFFSFAAGVATVSGFFLSFLLLRNHAAESRTQWDFWFPGWAQNEKGIHAANEMNFFWFWIFNTGIYLPLTFFGMWLKRNDTLFRIIALSGLLLFAVAELFNLQPYFYDNLKLFTLAFLFFAPFVGIALEKIASLPKIPVLAARGIAITLFASQIASATIDLHSFHTGLQNALFFSTDEMELAARFKSLRTSADEIVAIVPRHNHWLPCLTGNPVAMGYPGWLWSWGISYGEREKQLAEIFLGGARANEVVGALHIHYAAVQEGEKFLNSPVNVAFLDSHYRSLIQSGRWHVYSLTERLTSPTTSVR